MPTRLLINPCRTALAAVAAARWALIRPSLPTEDRDERLEENQSVETGLVPLPVPAHRSICVCCGRIVFIVRLFSVLGYGERATVGRYRQLLAVKNGGKFEHV